MDKAADLRESIVRAERSEGGENEKTDRMGMSFHAGPDAFLESEITYHLHQGPSRPHAGTRGNGSPSSEADKIVLIFFSPPHFVLSKRVLA